MLDMDLMFVLRNIQVLMGKIRGIIYYCNYMSVKKKKVIQIVYLSLIMWGIFYGTLKHSGCFVNASL